eukprot:TRINITY_DN3268_c0_g1_i1.p2 TRINITY_DN3268_c0_g1~~TRINITY_DN3268_c0_g1_i1.p2  ORF type:complete len:123 (+),score=53.42 TRINITY_DN3268_c0_g1_i1:87-455(+)
MSEVDHESFSLRPNYKKKFRANEVRDVIRKVLVEKLEGAEYNSDGASSLTKEVADLIRDRLKQKDYSRYKLIVNVFICQQTGDGVKMGCRCFWDQDTDSYAQDIYMNKALFAIATVFGIYHY